jgi:hypothetical protein
MTTAPLAEAFPNIEEMMTTMMMAPDYPFSSLPAVPELPVALLCSLPELELPPPASVSPSNSGALEARHGGKAGGAVELPAGLRTPQQTLPAPASPAWQGRCPSKAVLLETPKAKRRILATPPSGPAALQRRLQNDIEAALAQQSLPLLSLALMRGHCCGSDHCIHEAVRLRHLPALDFLLTAGGSEHLDGHCRGLRPLHWAVQACGEEGDVGYRMAELLLLNGSRPDGCALDDEAVDAPLHDATKRGCVAAVELLLAYGADPNKSDTNGYTPLHYVCRLMPFECGTFHVRVAELLLQHGALPSEPDAHGKSPLQYARDPSLRRKLLEAERLRNRRNLRLALGRGCTVGDSAGQLRESHEICWLLPEIFESVVGFL